MWKRKLRELAERWAFALAVKILNKYAKPEPQKIPRRRGKPQA
jgi:hypothetical protein